MEKLRSLSKVRGSVVAIDSVEESKQFDHRRAFDVLFQAQNCWNNMSRFRKDRERNKRYMYGDQWKDYIKVDGEEMTEEEYIQSQGNVPLKNNLIRRLVRNVLGEYRGQSKEPTCVARDRDEQQLGETMSIVLKCNMQLNRMSEMYARGMEEFLCSGMVAHRKWYGWNYHYDKLDNWTNNVEPNKFFVDGNMRDIRGWDCTIIGEVHDIDFGTLVHEFATSHEDYKRLANIYKSARDRKLFGDAWHQFGYDNINNYDFLFTEDPSRCRVIEVWRRETKARYRCHDYNSGDVYKIEVEDYDDMVVKVNEQRIQRGVAAGMAKEDIPMIQAEWFVDDYWYYYYLTPFGDILREGETPYNHKSHPYVFKFYPYLDGEIHSFVSDVIDQQRYTNRLITLYDWIMRASAKGVLLIPEDCIKDKDINEIADEWSRFNGVIAYTAKPGVPVPQQISANSTNIGIGELLNLQLKFFEDISGVNGAMQGKPGYSGMSGVLYAQQVQNGAISLIDLVETFNQFVLDAANKDVKNIQQFYTGKRVFNIAGKNGSTVVYDSEKLGDIDYDLSLVQAQMTSTYRQMANEFLMQIWSQGQISLEQLLENGDFPFADNLLQSIKTQKEQMATGQPVEGLSPELLQQAQGSADMSAVSKAYNMLSGNAE